MRLGALVALALLFAACGQGRVDHSGVTGAGATTPPDAGDAGDAGCPDDHRGRDGGPDGGCEDAGT